MSPRTQKCNHPIIGGLGPLNLPYGTVCMGCTWLGVAVLLLRLRKVHPLQVPFTFNPAILVLPCGLTVWGLSGCPRVVYSFLLLCFFFWSSSSAGYTADALGWPRRSEVWWKRRGGR